MFDSIEFQKKQPLPTKYFNEHSFKPFEYRNMMFYPTYSRNDNDIEGFYSSIGNMRMSYDFKRKEVTLKNSLPKFFAGYNHLNHKIEEYYHGIERISDITAVDWIDSNFRRAEIGTNFIEPHNLSDYKTFYKNSEFKTLRSKGNIDYQKKYSSSYYYLSLYDKWAEVLKRCKNPDIDKLDIPKDLKRFEIQFTNTYFHSLYKLIGSEKVYDFLTKDKIKLLQPKLDNILKNVTFENEFDLSKINGSENLKLFAMGKDKKIVRKYQEEHAAAYKKNRSKIKELLSISSMGQPQGLQKVFDSSWNHFLS